MKASTFKLLMAEQTEQVRQLIVIMPDKGDKEEASQKLCLLNALSDLEHCVNGVTDEDMV